MKSCFNCLNADIYAGTPDVYYLPNGDPGYPGDPPEANCNCKDDGFPKHLLDAMFDWPVKYGKRFRNELVEDIAPMLCGHYNPILVQKCGNCKRELNKPEYDWPLWCHGWDSFPVCSNSCLIEATRTFEEEIK